MDYTKFQDFEQRALSTVYAEVAGGFHDDLIPNLARHFMDKLAVPLASKILDIGCGPGVYIRAARDLGYTDVTGVTLSEDDAKVCTTNGFQTVLASMTDLPQTDSSVDFIWCRHALEHSPYPLFTLYEFHRVLRDHAQVFIEVPAPDNERAHMHEFNPNHYSILGDKMWQALFAKSGFDCQGVWYYDIDLPLDHRIYNERSYMYALKKSASNSFVDQR